MIFRISVASDEPRATLAGRDILAQGGTAADAAVAMAMTMAVTLPSRAGLGGGGACLVHDPQTGKVRALDFLPRSSAGQAGAGLPLMVRGLFALHAEYGALRWEANVIGAENAARFGVPVSRALAGDIRAAALPGPTGVSAGAPLIDASGRPLKEGDPLEQPELADLIGQIRSGGAAIFYGGSLGRRYAEAARTLGLPLDIGSVRDARPQWHQPLSVSYGRDLLYFLPEPAAPGNEQARVWQAAAETDDYEDLAAGERLQVLLSAERLAVGPGGRIGDPGLGRTASLVALSNDGMAVACGLTVNGPFGTGHRAPGTGVFVAPPAAAGLPMLAGLAMLVNEPKKQFIYGGVAESTAALMLPMVEVLLGEVAVGAALSTPRAGVDAADGSVVVEAAAPDGVMSALRQNGEAVRTVPDLGRAAVIFCLWDRAASSYCSAVADPRGSGLAFTAEG